MVIVVILLIMPLVNAWLGAVKLDDVTLRTLQLSIALIGIFLTNHRQLHDFERRLMQERKKQVTQHRLEQLDYVKNWLKLANSTLAEDSSLDKLGPGEERDNKIKSVCGNLSKLRVGLSLAILRVNDTDVGGYHLRVAFLSAMAKVEEVARKFDRTIFSADTSIAEAIQEVDRIYLEQLGNHSA